MKDSPEKAKKTLFPEDDSPISDSDENESTATYAKKVTTKRKFKFRNFSPTPKPSTSNTSPSSSPILLPSPNVSTIIISSDEELETSMIALEQQISLEMSSSD